MYPDDKSKHTPVKSQNVLPTRSKHTIDKVKHTIDKVKRTINKVKTYPLLLTNQGQLIDKWFVIDSFC